MLFDEDFLNHILEKINFIERTTTGKDIDLLLEDEVIQRAIVRSIGIIGQASKNVSNEFKAKYSQVEWRKIASTRNKVIHEYFGVDYKIVRAIIVENLPKLKLQIEAIIVS